jgi:Uma2 family endonuclease
MSTLASVAPLPQIDYPESDGEPMGETEIHRQEITDLIEVLAHFFRHRSDVYVAGNMFLYYEEGNPAAVVSPDVFVVPGVPKTPRRRSYKLWEEGRPPALVIEVSSRSTRLEDLGNKRALYALLGIDEYLLYDPMSEYLEPPLRGYRLAGQDYEPIANDADGSISSRLGVTLAVEGDRLRVVESATGEALLRPAEALDEVERLRAEVNRLRGGS